MEELDNEQTEFTLMVPYTEKHWSGLRKPINKERVLVFREAKICTVKKITAALVQLPTELYGHSNIDIALPFISGNLDRLTFIIAAAVQNDHKEPSKDLIAFIENNCSYSLYMEGLQYSIASTGMISFIEAYAMMKGAAAIINPEETDV